MFLTLLQSQGGPTPIDVIDTSDILDRNLRRRYDSPSEEEVVAAQLLKARQSKKRRYDVIKKTIDWKQLFTEKINAAETIEQLDAIPIPTIKTEAPEVTAAVLEEIRKKKEQKRLELLIAKQEAELKILEIESQAKAKIEEQRQVLQAARELQLQVIERYKVAVDAAIELERQAFEEARIAEEQAAEFTRKRMQRIKRLKALMWLTKLDL